jgi:hypothetical protein
VQLKSCEWIKSENLNDNYIYFFDPFVAHLLNLDKFDNEKAATIIYRDGYISFRKDALVIWDSQFCPVEGHLPKRWLDENENFQLLHNERDNSIIDPKGDTLQIRIYRVKENVELKNMK